MSLSLLFLFPQRIVFVTLALIGRICFNASSGLFPWVTFSDILIFNFQSINFQKAGQKAGQAVAPRVVEIYSQERGK